MGNAQDSWSRVPYATRQRIKSVLLARDGLMCCICHTKIASARVATIEHKRKRSRGGAVLDLANMGLAHESCNYGHNRKAIAVVDGLAFFGADHAGHPAPPVFPSPGRSEKNGREQG